MTKGIDIFISRIAKRNAYMHIKYFPLNVFYYKTVNLMSRYKLIVIFHVNATCQVD